MKTRLYRPKLPLNCLLWAVLQYRHARGGYILSRKSVHGWFPHFLWSPDLKRFFSYVPRYPRQRRMPPLLFDGYILRGDVRALAHMRVAARRKWLREKRRKSLLQTRGSHETA